MKYREPDPARMAEIISNSSNHFMCLDCLNRRWHSRPRKGEPRAMGFRFRYFAVDGNCCYCGKQDTDMLPFSTGNDREETCGGKHASWTERRR